MLTDPRVLPSYYTLTLYFLVLVLVLPYFKQGAQHRSPLKRTLLRVFRGKCFQINCQPTRNTGDIVVNLSSSYQQQSSFSTLNYNGVESSRWKLDRPQYHDGRVVCSSCFVYLCYYHAVAKIL